MQIPQNVMVPGSVEDLFRSIVNTDGDVAKTPAPVLVMADSVTLTLFILFCFPMVACNYLACQTHVIYWMGTPGFLSWGVPVLLCMGYIGLAKKRGRPKVWILSCILLPCVLFLILGNVHLSRASMIGSQLTANDCNSFTRKRELERSWWAAYKIYDTCVIAAMRGGLNRTLAEEATRVHLCAGYEELWPDNGENWEYLQHLEQEDLCSGWCTPQRPIWTFLKTKDACSRVAGDSMFISVRHTSLLLFVYSGVILIVAVVMLVFEGPIVGRVDPVV